MAKRAIAAVLLVAIAAWAEMAMAPMLAMHAGHMRPGHEMAADMPASHAGHHHAEHEQMVAERPCCPVLHKAESAPLLEIVSSEPACDDPHSCCFRQGPQSVPAPARDVQKLTRAMAPAQAVKASPALQPAKFVARDNSLVLPPLPIVFGMTLRV